MSHITTYKQIISDIVKFIDVCSQLGHEVRGGNGSALQVKQWGNQIVSAVYGIKIEGWKYELALTEEGKIQYDYFGSKTGSMERLHETVYTYNKEMVYDYIHEADASSWFEEETEECLTITLDYDD